MTYFLSCLYFFIYYLAISVSAVDLPILNKNLVIKDETPIVGVREQHHSINPANERDYNSFKLSEDPKCKDDIIRLCKDDARSHNFAVLECIQGQDRDDSALISEVCHNLLWNYKLNLTQSGRIEEIAKGMCKRELKKYPQCESTNGKTGHTISCMIDYLDKITDEGCQQHLIRLAVIIFSDYHLVGHMTENCQEDIKNFECGRIQNEGSPEPHSQGLTIECLSRHSGKLETKCHKQILRLAELQSEDFRTDRAFYFACREDREKFCKDIPTGHGRVYKCLMNHKKSRRMSSECTNQLSRLQGLMAQDYKVSHSLAKSCRSAIQENQCRKLLGDDSRDIKLSKILLCLEAAMRKGKKIDGNCQDEMLAHRQMVLEDFSMSPDLLVTCDTEVSDFCQGVPDARVMHCLMRHSKMHGKKKLSERCQRELEDVVKEADPGEDWRADPVLYEACLPVVQSRCNNVKGGEGRVMRCLMRQLNSPFMTPECEGTLLEIQYFIARDWKMDPHLYTACLNESVTLCNAQKNWIKPANDFKTDNSILVLPCLFRHAYHPNFETRISPKCTAEVKRVMHERADFVDLHPRIEMECMDALAKYCSDQTGPGQEINCLQHNLKNLADSCLEEVKTYTVIQNKDFRLHHFLMAHCSDILDKVCNNFLQNGPNGEEEDEDDPVISCLIENKNSPVLKENLKCRAIIEDIQIVMLEDISFTPAFKRKCQDDASRHCSDARNRRELLECLSKRNLNDILNGVSFSISKGCRQQIREQLTQRHESAMLDPGLKEACSADITRFCGLEFGGGVTLECLRKQTDLSPSCHKIIFQREKEESVDPRTDVVLMRKCKNMIKTFCHEDEGPTQILPCLMREKDNPDFDSPCKTLIANRMIEKSKDVHLNPQLYKACKHELFDFCSNEMNENNEVESNGRAIECLKKLMLSTKNKLGSQCTQKVIQMTKNAALNYKLDPILNQKCSNELKILCHSQDVESDDKGEVEECIKRNFKEDKLHNEECKNYIAQLMQVERVDIRADPVLYRVCMKDDKSLCKEEAPGAHLSCLYDVLERRPSKLTKQCQDILKERREMFKVAQKVFKLESFEDLVGTVKDLPNRNYVMIILLTVVGFIFLGGLMCGRASKHSYKLLKNR